MSKYYVLHKPYGYMSQFSPLENKETLADLLDIEKSCYPVGRLDEKSEGLLILTNDKSLTESLLNPENKHPRTYLVQVEGQITKKAIRTLSEGVKISLPNGDYTTLPAKVKKIGKPKLQERRPPVRTDVQSSWIKITLIEGKNRQIRRMTAKVGFPTLRLVRSHIVDLELGQIPAGDFRIFSKAEMYKKLGQST